MKFIKSYSIFEKNETTYEIGDKFICKYDLYTDCNGTLTTDGKIGQIGSSDYDKIFTKGNIYEILWRFQDGSYIVSCDEISWNFPLQASVVDYRKTDHIIHLHQLNEYFINYENDPEVLLESKTSIKSYSVFDVGDKIICKYDLYTDQDHDILINEPYFEQVFTKGKTYEILDLDNDYYIVSCDEISVVVDFKYEYFNDRIRVYIDKLNEYFINYENDPEVLLESKTSYSAVVIEEQEKQKLLKKLEFDIPESWQIIAHHMTIKMGELPTELKTFLYVPIKMKVIETGKLNDMIVAIKLEIIQDSEASKALIMYMNNNFGINNHPKFAHMTIAVNREKVQSLFNLIK